MNFVDMLGPSWALFLDFDGTVIDLASEPDTIVVPAGLVSTLQALNEKLDGALALISGRPIEQIDRYLHPLHLPVAGVHGAERRSGAGGITLLATQPLQRIEQAAAALASRYPQLRVERKRGSIALHYRQAPELESLCLQTMQAAVADSPGLTLLRGKLVVEAKPCGADKGRAIEAFLQEPPFAGRTPVFAGDDFTDEAGFETVQRLTGVGIKVGEGPTVACQRVDSPAALRHLLQAAAGQAGRVNA